MRGEGDPAIVAAAELVSSALADIKEVVVMEYVEDTHMVADPVPVAVGELLIEGVADGVSVTLMLGLGVADIV